MLSLKEAIEINTTIHTLNISWNYFGEIEENIKILKVALENNHTIEALYLYGNNLGNNYINELNSLKNKKIYY